MLEQAARFAIIASIPGFNDLYTEAFNHYCRPKWEQAFPVCEAELEGYGLEHVVLSGPTYSAKRREVVEKLSAKPRGTWAVFTLQFGGGHSQVVGLIADGIGGTYTVDRNATRERLVSEMVEMEIYTARNDYRRSIQIDMARESVRHRGYRPGMVLKDVEVAGTKFSSAHIVSITEEGKVKMVCTRRGSSKRWSAEIFAHGLPAPASKQVERPTMPEPMMATASLF